MTKFNVTLKYENKESYAHCAGKLNRSVVEYFFDVPEKSMIGLMIDLLDLPFEDKNNVVTVVEPSMEKLRKNIGTYVQDEKFLKSEYKRQKKAYAVFTNAVEYVKIPSVDFVEQRISKNETLRIERVA